ncbi:MAG: dTDP-4-dehydrorhamnose 3,5-epimerase [Pseudolabrys sp.]|jgi:dTDP-4-dehydrorhamnose 3,5-epimerase
MRFTKTVVDGVLVIDLDIIEDKRGFFARTYCEDEFAAAGITMRPVQCNLSHNKQAFTLRGMHYQAAPHGEAKLVQCVRGRIFDVAIDLRPQSQTFCRWAGVELSPKARRMLFIPEGCAHGYLTLENESDVSYLVNAKYTPNAGRGVRWNDPAFGIAWPTTPKVILPRDAAYPDFRGGR